MAQWCCDPETGRTVAVQVEGDQMAVTFGVGRDADLMGEFLSPPVTGNHPPKNLDHIQRMAIDLLRGAITA